MDDIDRGLHPKAQRTLIRQLKMIAANKAGPQLIVSTHSPYILDELPAESVRVVRSVNGGTRIRALVEHPEWQEWKSSMTSGEFWTYVGEDWMEQPP
jgi:predicted ATP-dependent endonuclease of OLD family